MTSFEEPQSREYHMPPLPRAGLEIRLKLAARERLRMASATWPTDETSTELPVSLAMYRGHYLTLLTDVGRAHGGYRDGTHLSPSERHISGDDHN
jgi:hypothetical protein